MKDKIISISLVEYGVFSPPKGMEDWRCYRVEYGGHAKDCLAEGHIWLPQNVNSEQLEIFLMGLQAYSQLWKEIK